MLDVDLRKVFAKALRCEIPAGNFVVSDLGEWDSLTHIKLVIELESKFGLNITPGVIPVLYSDFETVKSFVVDSGIS
jgi:acyl carrier protein